MLVFSSHSSSPIPLDILAANGGATRFAAPSPSERWSSPSGDVAAGRKLLYSKGFQRRITPALGLFLEVCHGLLVILKHVLHPSARDRRSVL
jgi:hypothetical protein